VYRLVHGRSGRWSETELYSFCSADDCGDGALPEAGVIFDAAGTLYGTTFSGGAYGHGIVFQLAPGTRGSWTETVMYSFERGTDGGTPIAGLVVDSTGDLYGTTIYGGNVNDCEGGCGTVFEITP
jgi:uncharacterized repeat protein (TIGR03803 family)